MIDQNSELLKLVELSRYFGGQKDYVIAGGGNSSFKNKHKLWIKASGESLARIDVEGLVCLSRALLDKMSGKPYPQDHHERESQIAQDLRNAVLYPKDRRPSVEALLHHLIDFSYVLHTHPTYINGLLCSSEGARIIHRLYGDEVLYIPYTNPGYELAQQMVGALGSYSDRMGYRPNIILLQNHGVFVGANSPEAIRAFYTMIRDAFLQYFPVTLPDDLPRSIQTHNSRSLEAFFNTLGYHTGSYTSKLIGEYSRSAFQYQKISKPLTPDQIVYCGAAYPFISDAEDVEDFKDALIEFKDHHGYFPRVMVLEGEGIMIASDMESALQTILNVFIEALRVVGIAEGLGGLNAMTDDQVRFIDRWESEHYRRNVARNEGPAQ